MAQKNHGEYSLGGGEPVDFDEPTDTTEIEEYDEAKDKGPSERWTYWSEQIQASLNSEERFRNEGREAERSYFGDENKAYTTEEYKKDEHQTNIIHANIEVLKPLLFSDVPDPIVRRRFGGDGDNDPTDRVAALVAQRLADFLIDTTNFETSMEQARDDWLIPGRGNVRVMYSAKFESQPVINPISDQPFIDSETNQPFMQEVKASESIKVRHWPWSRVMYGASNTWDELPFIAYETPMTKKQVEKRFDDKAEDGSKPSELMNFPIDGLKGNLQDGKSDDLSIWEPDKDSETSNTPSVNAHSQCIVYEIWDKESKKVIWWSPHYRDDVLDEADDPLGLEEFFNSPKPLLAVTKAGMLTPRPDIAFYKARADEIDIATKKLASILNSISLSGAYPGKMVEEMKLLLKGDKNRLIAIEEWVSFLENGGTQGIIQWLPIDQFIKAAQALIVMREQSKEALYEISGVSDILRGQSDPNETLGAQQIKGNYANIRLRDRQRKMQKFARDAIRLMVEIAVEHFDTKTIADIVNLELPMTDQELQQMNAKVEQGKQQHAILSKMAQQTGQPPPPEPSVPFFEQTSWERVHGTLKDDMTRKFSLSIETDGTILQDQEEDKRQRVEFLQAFSGMVESLFPMAQSGVIEMKIIKELLLFAVRGFPKSRTLEGMLATLPDTINTEPPEDTAVTVAKIRAQVDLEIAKMREKGDAQEGQADRQHEMRIKGAEMLADSLIGQVGANT